MRLFVVQGGRSSYTRFFLPLARHAVDVIDFSEFSAQLAQRYETLMFSLTSIAELTRFDQFHRDGWLVDKTLAVGGQFLLCVKDHESFREHYGIDHLCVGHGARLLDALCKGEPVERGVYREKEPYVQTDLLLQAPDLYRRSHELRLLLDFGCSWNQCLFCHHQYPDVEESMGQRAFAQVKEHIIYDSAIRRLSFIDNEFSVPFLVEHILEDDRLMSQIDYLYFFGLRCLPDVERIEPYLRRYPQVVFDMRFGLEFVSQPLLKRYRKGYHFKQFTTKNAFLFDSAHPNLIANFYLLSGLPGMDLPYYRELAEFTRRHATPWYLLSYFLLDDYIAPRFEALPEVEIGKAVRLDEFNGAHDAPGLETHYLHFEIDGKTQADHFANVLAPSGILGQSSVYYDDYMFPFRLPACADIERARRLDKHNGEAGPALKTLRALQRDFDDSGLRADELGYPELPSDLGELSFAAGDYSAALAAYQQAERYLPADGRINRCVALCHAALGQLGAARSAYHKGVFKSLVSSRFERFGLEQRGDTIVLHFLGLDDTCEVALDAVALFVLLQTPRPITRDELLRVVGARAPAADVEAAIDTLVDAGVLVGSNDLGWVNLLQPGVQHQVELCFGLHAPADAVSPQQDAPRAHG